MRLKVKPASLCLLILMAGAGCPPVLADGVAMPSQNPNTRHNVMMIVSDALRQDALGCYGGRARTPNLDWLAQNGVLFENAYTTSPWTVPSSVSMFTGNYATTYGYTPFEKTLKIHVPDSEYLFAESLVQLGYRNLMKIENVHASLHNNLQGFEPLPEMKAVNEYLVGAARENVALITGGEYHNSAAYIESFIVLGGLLNMRPETNFFLLHWIIDPHEPYNPVGKFKSRISADASSLPQDPKVYSQTLSSRSQLSSQEQQYIKDLYVAEIESVDERVGFVIEALRRTGRLEDTFVIVTSDHGEQFGEHGGHGHGNFGRACNYYEVLMKIPLIISGPGLTKGRRVTGRVTHLDLMPTLRDLLGIEYGDSMQGESYRDLMLGEPGRGKYLYFDDVREHDQVDALLEGDFKLICSGEEAFELYNLADDVYEKTDRSSAHPDLVRSMYKKIVNIREENRKRLAANMTALDKNKKELSDKEREEIVRRLKALGYID